MIFSVLERKSVLAKNELKARSKKSHEETEKKEEKFIYICLKGDQVSCQLCPRSNPQTWLAKDPGTYK